MSGFTKLFSSILQSSIWLEDDQTVRVWVAMLALADRDGLVRIGMGGLAAQARVSKEKTRAAIEKFLAPDPDSTSREHDGRRIAPAPDGWILLNYRKYREARDQDNRREQNREAQKRRRSKKQPTPEEERHAREVDAQDRTHGTGGKSWGKPG